MGDALVSDTPILIASPALFYLAFVRVCVDRDRGGSEESVQSNCFDINNQS